MLYVGLDLSRQRLDVHVLDEEGRTVDVLAVHPGADALRPLANRILRHGQEVSAVGPHRSGWDGRAKHPDRCPSTGPLLSANPPPVECVKAPRSPGRPMSVAS